MHPNDPAHSPNRQSQPHPSNRLVACGPREESTYAAGRQGSDNPLNLHLVPDISILHEGSHGGPG